MKTATIQQVPQQWTEILGWIAEGEIVEVMQEGTIVAKFVPVSTPRPDFLARAKMIWGENPVGKPLSELVHESRRDE
jgi:antitoxin (DNA-binding transcriptional repressor) of toxin-antitoxin stability system